MPNASLELFIKKKSYILPNGKSKYWVKFQPLRHCEGSEQAIHTSKFIVVRPKIRAFVPRRKNRATQWTSPADATRKRVYCWLRKPGDSDLLGGRAPWTANWASFYGQKTPHYQHITYGYKVIGYMFAKQSYWYKLRGLHAYKAILLVQLRGLLFKLKAILLVQTARAFVQT